MQQIREISWLELQRYCEQLADQLKDIKIKRIYGIARGGLVIAVMLSHLLNIREVHSIGLTSYIGQKKRKLKRLSDLPRELKNALIIDDIINTGDTLSFVYKNVELKNCYFATVFRQNDHLYDFEVTAVEHTYDWIKFPFEV